MMITGWDFVTVDEDVSPAERVTRDAREILQMREEPEPAEEPRVDPRRSRVTARDGRSDDWKGRQYGRQVRS
ncbi:hypothetical protein EVB39_105 [Rhizobium phage RHph_TM3_3_9]|nr:hypothetical protein EVB39_105 [Rhizobium phage RHph_TM3_3_9]QIG68626.1 hypothetical protein EVB66_105 [Rhizobium phage RHph_TM3_3_13]QIG74484.1 hypothetical protein EVC09_104 [Rhizobium phage RHph_TM3_3_10]QXV74598.1 hypothetical protein [Rhizobium phage RHEph19]